MKGQEMITVIKRIFIIVTTGLLMGNCAPSDIPKTANEEKTVRANVEAGKTSDRSSLALQRLKETAVELKNTPVQEQQPGDTAGRGTTAKSLLAEVDAEIRKEIELGDKAMAEGKSEEAAQHYELAVEMIKISPDADRLNFLREDVERKRSDALNKSLSR